MFIGYIILALILFAFVHFVLESIVAPSEQAISRARLLQLAETAERDKRLYKDRSKKEALEQTRASAYSIVGNMPRHTLSTLFLFIHRVVSNPDFKQDIEQTMKRLRETEDDHIKGIRHQMVAQADRVFLVNSIGWCYFIIPIIVTKALMGKIKRAIGALVTASPVPKEPRSAMESI